jgi:hypothetical protein
LVHKDLKVQSAQRVLKGLKVMMVPRVLKVLLVRTELKGLPARMVKIMS